MCKAMSFYNKMCVKKYFLQSVLNECGKEAKRFKSFKYFDTRTWEHDHQVKLGHAGNADTSHHKLLIFLKSCVLFAL